MIGEKLAWNFNTCATLQGKAKWELRNCSPQDGKQSQIQDYLSWGRLYPSSLLRLIMDRSRGNSYKTIRTVRHCRAWWYWCSVKLTEQPSLWAGIKQGLWMLSLIKFNRLLAGCSAAQPSVFRRHCVAGVVSSKVCISARGTLSLKIDH